MRALFLRGLEAIRSPFAPLVAGLVLLVVLLFGLTWVTEQRGAENALVRETLQTRAVLWQTLSTLQDMETGQRGFLLTGEQAYIEPFERGQARLAGQLDTLEERLADDADQKTRLAALRAVTTEKVQELTSTINIRRAGDTRGMMLVIRGDRGKQLMDNARAIIDHMLRDEEQELVLRQQNVQRANALVQIATIATILGVVVLGFITIGAAQRTHRSLAESAAAATAAYKRILEETAARETAEGQVRQLQKMEAIGQLTGGVAHDFNNMLAVISSSLQLLRRRIERGQTDVMQFVEAAQDAANRAASLTSRLLAFSRQQPLSPQTLDLNRLVSGMSELLRRTLGETIEMESVLAGGLWKTYADPSQLENALLNLCVNARDAMPEGGRLTIETANAHLDDSYSARHAEVPAGQYVMICVSDTGHGMPADVAARAFDPFFTTKPVGKGTGLGLSQVYGYVKQSGGHVKIYSERGEGTTIKIYLPRSDRAEEQQDTSASRIIRPGTPTELVLVVEDEERVRMVSVAALRDLGYTVIHASNGPEALAKLDQHPGVALMFTDVVMPNMSGRVLSDEALKRHPELKVLYTTGYTQNAVVHNGVLDRDAQLLMKPYSLDQLAAKVRDILDKPKS